MQPFDEVGDGIGRTRGHGRVGDRRRGHWLFLESDTWPRDVARAHHCSTGTG